MKCILIVRGENIVCAPKQQIPARRVPTRGNNRRRERKFERKQNKILVMVNDFLFVVFT